MISNDLANLSDYLAGFALHRRQMEPERWAQLAAVLADLSQRAAAMECAPILAGRIDWVGAPADRDDG